MPFNIFEANLAKGYLNYTTKYLPSHENINVKEEYESISLNQENKHHTKRK